MDRASFGSLLESCVMNKRHWPNTSPSWLKNSGKQYFLPWGDCCIHSGFSFSLQCPRQRFWPLEGHLTTETSYRYVLVAGQTEGPLPCQLFLRPKHCLVRTSSSHSCRCLTIRLSHHKAASILLGHWAFFDIAWGCINYCNIPVLGKVLLKKSLKWEFSLSGLLRRCSQKKESEGCR